MSTAMWTFEPLRRLAPSYPALAPLSGVEISVVLSKMAAEGCAAPADSPEEDAEVVGHRLEDARFDPALGLLVDGGPGREVAGEVAPRSTGADHPSEPVEDGAEVVLALGGLGSEQGEIGGDEGPFLVGDVGGVARGHARSLLRARPEVHNTL